MASHDERDSSDTELDKAVLEYALSFWTESYGRMVIIAMDFRERRGWRCNDQRRRPVGVARKCMA